MRTVYLYRIILLLKYCRSNLLNKIPLFDTCLDPNPACSVSNSFARRVTKIGDMYYIDLDTTGIYGITIAIYKDATRQKVP